MNYWRDCGLEFEFTNNELFNEQTALIILKECKFPISSDSKDFLSWVIKNDESCGIEITTPIIESEKQFSDIRKLTDKLNSDFREQEIINNRCGLHVHIDVSDYKNMQCIRNLANIISILEKPVIYKMIKKNRIRNKYCKSTNFSKKLNGFGKNISKFKKNVELKFDRNRGLNLRSLQKFGTVEFRYHHATIDFKEIWNWIYFLQTVVDFASYPGAERKINFIKKYNLGIKHILYFLIELEKENINYILNKKHEDLNDHVWNFLPEKK